MLKIHLASQPIGLVQKCLFCGETLLDYTNSQAVGDWQPHWWRGCVEVGDGRSVATRAAPNCSGRTKDQVDKRVWCDALYHDHLLLYPEINFCDICGLPIRSLA